MSNVIVRLLIAFDEIIITIMNVCPCGAESPLVAATMYVEYATKETVELTVSVKELKIV